MSRHLNRFFLAVQFLTRLPVPASVRYDEREFAACTPYVPVVGTLVGLLQGLVLCLLRGIWPAPLAAGLTLLVGALITGAFHEDALADAADGLGGGHSRAEKLAIMRDSRIGSYGALALWFLLTLRWAALSQLAAHGPALAAGALVTASTLGRWSSLPLLRTLPYAREEGGLGKPLAGAPSRGAVLAGTIYTLLVAGSVGRERGVAAFVGALLVVGSAARYLRAALGGSTGDALGAVNVLVELCGYLIFTAWNFS